MVSCTVTIPPWDIGLPGILISLIGRMVLLIVPCLAGCVVDVDGWCFGVPVNVGLAL